MLHFITNVNIVPNMVLFGAHTSKVAFIQALITQWYWKWCLPEQQFCFIDSQFMFLAAIFHDSESVGHRLTYRIVAADSSQKVNDDTFNNNLKIYQTLNNKKTLRIMSHTTFDKKKKNPGRFKNLKLSLNSSA